MDAGIKIFLEILLAVTAVIIIIYLFFHSIGFLAAPVPSQNLPTSSVCLEENCFQVELATTEVQRDRGLMYRTELDKDKGMLFIFDDEGIYPFWMKNTLIPLDIIWIDSSSKVVFISQNVQPCKTLICPTVAPQAKVKYVLEVNAGICGQIGLKLGDQIQINIK